MDAGVEAGREPATDDGEKKSSFIPRRSATARRILSRPT